MLGLCMELLWSMYPMPNGMKQHLLLNVFAQPTLAYRPLEEHKPTTTRLNPFIQPLDYASAGKIMLFIECESNATFMLLR